jgi:hypothetical protein
MSYVIQTCQWVPDDNNPLPMLKQAVITSENFRSTTSFLRYVNNLMLCYEMIQRSREEAVAVPR